MTSIIETGTPRLNESDAIQIGFNAEQLPRQSPPNGNGIMAGSTTAAVTSSPDTGNAVTLVSPTQMNGFQTLNQSQSQSQNTEVAIKAHAQTGSPTVLTSSGEKLNGNTDSELSTPLVSEASTVNTVVTPPVPVPVVLPSVSIVSESSDMPAEISNGLPSIPIIAANTGIKAITEIKTTLDLNTNTDSRSNCNSDMEIDDDRLPLQSSQSDTTPGSGSLDPNITATSTSVSENILIPSSQLNGDRSVSSETIPASYPGETIDDITKFNPASNTRTDIQNTSTSASVVFRPHENPALRSKLEHALRSLVGETAIDSKLVIRLARELKLAKNQTRENKDNATGSGEDVQHLERVSALVAEGTLANDEIARLRQQLSDINNAYKGAVEANQKFDLELCRLKESFMVKLKEVKIVSDRNRELEIQLFQSQSDREVLKNQRALLTKRCEALHNELDKFRNVHNAVGPGALTRVNGTQSQSPMNSNAANGNSTIAPVSRQHNALVRRPSIVPSHSVSEVVNALSAAKPSQSPWQALPMLSPAAGPTPVHNQNGSPIAFAPPRFTGHQQGTGQQRSEMVSTPPMFEYQLQQMSAAGQQQTGPNPVVSPMGQLSPAYQQQQTVVPHQMQLSNQQVDPVQRQIAAHYMANHNVLRQQAHSFPGLVPRDAATGQRPVMPPGHQRSQSGEVHMQTQLRKDLPLASFSGSGAPRTHPTPPTMLSQQLPYQPQPQPQRIHNQAAPGFSQNQSHVPNAGGSQPWRQQKHYVSVPPTPTTTTSSPGSSSTQNPPQAGPHASQRQPPEIPLEHSNAVTARRNIAQPPHAPYPFPPQSYVVSPSQVFAQPYALQATETQQNVLQGTQAASRTTDASCIIDLTMDESEETEIEGPPKKRQKVEEAQSQCTVMTLTEAGPASNEKQVVEDGVESTVVDAEQPMEVVLSQADASPTMVIEPKTASQPQLVDGLNISSEEFTALLAEVFQDSENDTSTTCFFCAERKEDDAVDWPETHLQNPAVEDMVNHLKEVHPLAWEKICNGEY